MQLTLYFQALQELQVSYTVFTHLLDAENQIRGQMYSIPGRGETPTTSWIDGEVIIDEYEIVVDPEVPPDDYVLEIGIYDAATGERLPVRQVQRRVQEDRILLEGIRVVTSR